MSVSGIDVFSGWTISIDIDVRSLSDYMFLKSRGLFGLTHDLKWLYHIFNPHIVRNMPLGKFLVLTKKGCIGFGEFPEVPWHKRERENILKAVGVKCEYGEPVETGEYRGTFKTIGDHEHADIIHVYAEEGIGMQKIGKELGRSSASIKGQIDKHNHAVERSGFCPACRRVRSSLESDKAER